MKLATHAGTVFTREMLPILRNPVGLVFTMTQPVVFLLLFGPLLGGVSAGDGSPTGGTATGDGTPTGGGTGPPWEWFVPGILVMLAVFGTTGAGYSLLVEISGGSLERMLVTPLNRAAMLVGRTAKEVATLLVQAALIIAVAVPFGLSPRPAGMLAALLLLAVFGVGLGALAFALALALRRQEEVFYGVQQVLLFPLVLLAGVLLPLEGAPGWLSAAARLNPVTYVVDAERSLFAGEIWAGPVLSGTLVALGIAALGLALGTRAMRRATL